MLKYNMFEAIELRGKTIAQAGLADIEICSPKIWDDVIDFRTSIQISEGNGGWPEPPLVYEVLGNGPDVQARKTKKATWKLVYGQYRKYMRQMYEDVK